MASLDFEREKTEFRDYYGANLKLMEDAKGSLISLLNALVARSAGIELSKIEGRIKDREECLRKFNHKYRTELEKSETPYEIKDHISDLIGLRIVCLYEDNIESIYQIISQHFSVREVTDKIAAIESTESSFGYKGLHLDVKIGPPRDSAEEYRDYADLSFEIQIRTIVQDSWSVLDHKIKYKKAIPNNLKRRINTLAALFELADREFKQIREATDVEIKKAQGEDTEQPRVGGLNDNAQSKQSNGSLALDAFGFLRVAQHFFQTYDFEAHKVDGFTAEIVKTAPEITRRDFNECLRHHITRVKRYQMHFEKQNPEDALNPYTLIRHCLYLEDKSTFHDILNNVARDSFEQWLHINERNN
ncbi:GTP pyrophosphokinase [Achromobacter xylosoxidans]|uniref:GTP pyrophosphokinase n=1 Tax=Alcaligenes xylosoxydans xylosoxydans TaxID=85698 RepID=UPI0009EC856A|nr:(p)ppGpp synthetase [Achromobacter xylosoxidans]